MKLSKAYLALLFVSVIFTLYSCDSITDSSQPNEIQSQNLTIDSDAKKDKVPVCHLTGNDDYILISIAEPALKAHIKHGDAQPGDPVPDMNGYIFDDNCEPILVIPACFKEILDDINDDNFAFEDYNWNRILTKKKHTFSIETTINGEDAKLTTSSSFFKKANTYCSFVYVNDNGETKIFRSDPYPSSAYDENVSYLKSLL